MTKKKYLAIFFILFLSFILRFYRLGDVPHGMTWDEAAIGYNGYAILTTRRDEWLERLPISFKSFGDYKAPLAIYLNGFFTFIFGMNLFAVRLPFALFGVGSVLAMIFLTQEFMTIGKLKNVIKFEILALISGMMIALSPWHLHFSRAGFESGISLFFLIWAIFFLLKFFTEINKKTFVQKIFDKNFAYVAFLLFLSVIFSVMSIYSYHSAKITTPLLILSTFIIFRKSWLIIFRMKRILKIKFALLSFIGFITSVLMLRPMIVDSIYGNGLARSETLIFGQNLTAVEVIKTVLYNFFVHLSPNFLFLGETTSLRHGDGVWGVLLPTTWVIVTTTFIYSLFIFIKNKPTLTTNFQNKFLFALVWIILGVLPACLGVEIPHSNRALLALPGFILIATLGIQEFLAFYKQTPDHQETKKMVFKSIAGMTILLHLLFFISYLGNYFKNFSIDSAESFNDGYLEAFNYVIPYEKGLEGKKEADKIIFTSEYGQPYIYALFTRRTNPIWYQGGSLIKYEFKENINIEDLGQKNAVVVAGMKSSDLPSSEADHLVFGSDGKIRFKIFITEK